MDIGVVDSWFKACMIGIGPVLALRNASTLAENFQGHWQIQFYSEVWRSGMNHSTVIGREPRGFSLPCTDLDGGLDMPSLMAQPSKEGSSGRLRN